MKIAIAQIEARKDDLLASLEKHCYFADFAAGQHADLIFFPELSLTSYEPRLAAKLALSPEDNRLEVLQTLSHAKNISIGMGIPTRSENGIQISMAFFHPDRPVQLYSKQLLHRDELPFFVPGHKQIFLTNKDKKIAPAICYESLQAEHSENAYQNAADIYIASVAKSEEGVKKAFRHFPLIAKKYNMPVLMSNYIGHCDDFLSCGHTAVWNADGQLIDQLDAISEGLLIFNTETNDTAQYLLKAFPETTFVEKTIAKTNPEKNR